MEAAPALDTGSLVFIGFMGAGKSLAARTAGAAMGVEAVDSDHLLERRLGSSIEDYFGSHGERAFREQEEEAVCELLEAPPAPVLSLGGGAITSERVRAALARHTVVLLDVDAETAWQRCRSGRPLARDRDRFDRLHAERAPLYAGLADVILPAERRDEVRRALPAIRDLAHFPPGTKLLWAGDYPVFVGDGVLSPSRWPVPGRRFLVTDEAVGPHYAERLGDVERDVRIAPGEAAKTLETAGEVLRALARCRHGPRRPRGRARRRRGGGRGGLLRRRLPARGAGRAGADHAGRHGRLRLRRQDRRRPAGGQELRRRLPPARGGAGRPVDAGDPARRGARGRLGRGGQDRPDRRRRPVAARAIPRAHCYPTATSCSPARA